jgi:hypothetical protein
MITKSTRVGGDVDAYCTKCRMDLNHRVIAMVRDDPKRVECLTCHGQHNYRRPAAEKAREQAAKANREPRAIGSSSKAASRSTSSGGSSSRVSERSGRAFWEKSIAGQAPSAFRAYRISERFSEGDLVRHSRFGDGVVARIVDPNKVEVLFEDGPRTMAQGVS